MVTFAVMMTFAFTGGVVFDALRAMVAFVGGAFPPDGVPPPTGGAVGDSALQPAKIRSSARSANIIFRCLILIISTPVNSYHPPTRAAMRIHHTRSRNRVSSAYCP